jgi:hypothetical protein
MTGEQIIIAILLTGGMVLLHLLLKQDKKEPGKILFTIFTNQKNQIKGEIKMVSIKVTQEQDLQISPADRRGNPAPVENGSVFFSSSDESIFTVHQNPDDGTKAVIKATGVGVAQLNVTADADLGEGVETIEGFTGVEILPAQAVGFGFIAGEIREQPDTDTEG